MGCEMEEWRKIVILASMVALLVAMLIQSAFDGQCMKYSADGAKITVSGVYCWRDKDIFREYYRLSDLREKHEGPPVDLIIRPTPTFGQGL